MGPIEHGSAAGDGNKRSKFGLLVGGLLIAAVAFSLGTAVGNGSLALRPTQGASSKALPADLDYASVEQVYDVLRKEYDGKLTEGQLLDGLKAGLAEATGDPYTEYFTSSKYKTFNEQLNGAGFSGIGAELGLDKDKNLIVVAPIAGTPASTAGIKPQDIIAEIDGKVTTGLSVEEAVSKIRGKKGTEVKLKLIRARAETIDVKIVRDDIKVPTVEAKALDDNIGYIRVTTFGDNTGELVAKEAQALKDKGVGSMVLDLRGNPGGVVDTAIQIASLWLPKGKLIMQEKRGDTVIQTYTSNGNDILKDMPTTVLLDAGSASASEIVAGALRDNNAAKIVGEKSYGKGVVQGLEPLGDGSQLKVTVARWYRPNGQNIDKKGIEPDQKITISDEDAAAGKDTQLEAAQASLKR